MIEIRQTGNFKNAERFLSDMQRKEMFASLKGLADVGVAALASATPMRSGLTAASWGYDIVITKDDAAIHWTNSNIINGFSVAIGLQYGHGTGTGGWVSGQDYINPVIQPIFDKIADEVWKVVTNS